jgi:hypothetical protein
MFSVSTDPCKKWALVLQENSTSEPISSTKYLNTSSLVPFLTSASSSALYLFVITLSNLLFFNFFSRLFRRCLNLFFWGAWLRNHSLNHFFEVGQIIRLIFICLTIVFNFLQIYLQFYKTSPFKQETRQEVVDDFL